MDRPTPVQARLMHILVEHPAVKVLWNGRQAKLIGPATWKVEQLLEREGVQLRSSSLRAITSRGWMEPDEPIGNAYDVSQAGREALSELEPDDFISPVPTMTARDVHRVLQQGFYGDTWAYFTEVTLDGWTTERRIDALAFRINAPHELHAVEVKVNRGDFLRELEDRTKRLPAQQLAHCFYFAAPAGLIKDHELPDGCGLLEVHGTRTVSESVEPDYTRPERPTWGLFASLMRVEERVVT